ncbi:DUF5518 domain-containing protein [Halorussus marinus]|uniref:DUF5518 domain-containing protein n=1 Tax=Halorussus marinus TaxID=2505976 RepID=UPI00143D2B40|nr:DUF5518 domain-containing protein [Halorussus marinus]
MSLARLRAVPPAWRFALVGALASIPLTVLLDRLPDAEANVAGGIMVLGAFIAGAAAALSSNDAGGAGLRAGLLAGLVAVLAPVRATVSSAIGATGIPSPSGVGTFVAFGGLVVALASTFGLACGRLGGWVVSALTTRSATARS